jgi:GMP synthase (glutamine-hydrolysing)
MNASKLLVIRHETGSSLGMLKVPDIDSVKYLNMAQGETLAEPIAHFSHLVVLGGAISAYEADLYPFLYDEFRLIEQAIAQEIPIVGICLGSQILAQVLGARVYRGEAGREVGWCEVQLNEAAKADVLLRSFPESFRVFQSHQDTFELPQGAVRLASSDRYPNQAFRYGDRIWALQFHLEIDERVLADCGAVIQQELIDSQIQDTSLAQLLSEAKHHAAPIAPIASRFMQDFLQVRSMGSVSSRA